MINLLLLWVPRSDCQTWPTIIGIFGGKQMMMMKKTQKKWKAVEEEEMLLLSPFFFNVKVVINHKALGHFSREWHFYSELNMKVLYVIKTETSLSILATKKMTQVEGCGAGQSVPEGERGWKSRNKFSQAWRKFIHTLWLPTFILRMCSVFWLVRKKRVSVVANEGERRGSSSSNSSLAKTKPASFQVGEGHEKIELVSPLKMFRFVEWK